jgi:predicted transcriptional regulator
LKYRSRTDIIATILQAAKEGATKTHLMYGAYLSYAQIQEYIAFLREKGLLMYEEGVQHYKPTENGLHFLHVYEQISELIVLPKTPPNVVAQLSLDNENNNNRSTASSIQE